MKMFDNNSEGQIFLISLLPSFPQRCAVFLCYCTAALQKDVELFVHRRHASPFSLDPCNNWQLSVPINYRDKILGTCMKSTHVTKDTKGTNWRKVYHVSCRQFLVLRITWYIKPFLPHKAAQLYMLRCGGKKLYSVLIILKCSIVLLFSVNLICTEFQLKNECPSTV